MEPCMCGATDCPSCGPAQGYEVVRVWSPKHSRYVFVNPEDIEEATGEESGTESELPPDA